MRDDAKDLRVWRLFPGKSLHLKPPAEKYYSGREYFFRFINKASNLRCFNISMVTDTVHRFTYCVRLNHKPTPDACLGERFVLRRPINMRGVAYKYLVDNASRL